MNFPKLNHGPKWFRDLHPREYNRWKGMIIRVIYTKSGADFRRYKERGITICERWFSFESFYEDMGEIPRPDYSIDRIDNNGNYCKENCRWTDAKTQARNRCSNLVIEFRGEKHLACVWSEKLGLGTNVLINRLQLGWSVERALTTPAKKRNRHKKALTPEEPRLVNNCVTN